ncbi:hypothetical protein NMY22_g14967 [Coprinellus aureogranulatus]|nr:hypothetical protein NMY22_g14967 [Coprinellus aureogranulatus]
MPSPASDTSHVDIAITHGDVNIHMDSLTCAGPTANIYDGSYQGITARITEYRHLTRRMEAGIDTRAAFIANAILRRQNRTSKHVEVAGVYQTGDASTGSLRTFLVEAPYNYTGLPEYLTANPDVNRLVLFKAAAEILADLHARGLVHGSVGLKDFAVDTSGSLLLSGFEHMRIEDHNAPFRPTPSLSVNAMTYMAPELLRSFKDDGIAGLTKSSDVYALGCFAYELFTGENPFAKHFGGLVHMAQYRLISAVVHQNERPRKPAAGSAAYTRYGLTDKIWCMVHRCWARDPATRPSVTDILMLPGRPYRDQSLAVCTGVSSAAS